MHSAIGAEPGELRQRLSQHETDRMSELPTRCRNVLHGHKIAFRKETHT